MKKSITSLFAFFCLVYLLTSCIGPSSYAFISEDHLYSKGTQTIVIPASDDAKFSSEITKNQIELPTTMKGKEVDGVSYKDETKIEITISGSLESVSSVEDYTYHTFSIKKGGLTGNNSATVVISCYNYAPYMESNDISYSNILDKVKATSGFTLPYGEFIEENCNEENITLPDTNGTIALISVEEDTLNIKIENYTILNDYKYPIIKISAKCTSFNKDLYVFIGKVSMVPLVD